MAPEQRKQVAVRPGLPVQLHIADPDTYHDAAEVSAWEQDMAGAGASVQTEQDHSDMSG